MDPRGPTRPAEQESIITTIVGGRPPGCGQPLGKIPRGLEILLKKSAVDPDFHTLLLAKRSRAAGEIALSLDPAEAAMLDAVPAAQLEALIARTKVKPEHRAAFLGKAAALMLITIGMQTLACDHNSIDGTFGIQPDQPITHEEEDLGGLFDNRPDRPETSASEAPSAPEANPHTYTSRGIQPDRISPQTEE